MNDTLPTLRRRLDLAAARHTALLEQHATAGARIVAREADVRAVVE